MEFITRHMLKTEIIAPVIILLVSIFLCSISKKIVYRIFKFNTAKLNEGKKKSIANLINNIIKAGEIMDDHEITGFIERFYSRYIYIA